MGKALPKKGNLSQSAEIPAVIEVQQDAKLDENQCEAKNETHRVIPPPNA
ncbi:hypothetical protein OS190_08040 [Sulfitobacter sp. F26204]|nr:hypothetical protein [Sulfitobacter sp. F26204]MCX7559519.1 hypothetical protein [Sulfitobacter sp. F26204]